MKEITAETYEPEFMTHNCTKFTATGQVQPLNPNICLTRASAVQLAHILADLRPTIVMADPYRVVGNSVTFVSLVPWFKFPSGCCVNAGTEGAYWPPAPDGKTAEQRCRADIEAAEDQFEIEGDAQYPVQLSAAPK